MKIITYSEAKKSLHKKEPWLNVLILKHLTVPLAFLISKYTNVKPSVLTFLSLMSTVIAGYFIINGDLIFGTTAYFIAYIFDAIDGKVSRIKGLSSSFGMWFDIAIDRINIIILLVSYSILYSSHSVYFFSIIFMGLFFLGFESRYNIQFDKLNKGFALSNPATSAFEENDLKKGFYGQFCDRFGLIKQPISLVEIILFVFIVAPLFNIYEFSLIGGGCVLFIRVIAQQIYWIE